MSSLLAATRVVSRVLSGVRPPEFPRYKLNKLARPACYDCQSEGKNGLKWCNTSSLTSGGQIKTGYQYFSVYLCPCKIYTENI